MAIALTPFKALVGIRPGSQIYKFFKGTSLGLRYVSRFVPFYITLYIIGYLSQHKVV